mgnify:FL=1
MFRADAKAQVSYDYDTGRITTFLCSVQHSPDVEVSDFRHIIESMMVLAACEYTEERAKACDFSDPYYTDLPPVILVKAANADKYKTVDDINQASVIIGAQKNTTKAMAAADMFPEAANGMVLESLVPTLVTELKNGTIDLLVLDGNVGLSYVG